MNYKLSDLPKTWILDLDGTILKHNGYIDDKEEVLEGVEDFLNQISDNDLIIILTARDIKYKESTIDFLKRHNIKFNDIIFNVPVGERILINDKKPSGLPTAHAINVQRDGKLDIVLEIDKEL